MVCSRPFLTEPNVQPEHALAIVGRALNRASSEPGSLPSNRDLRAAAACLLTAVPAPALAAERAQLEAALAARTLRIDAAFEASLAALADHLGAQGVVAQPEPAPSGYQPNVVPRGVRLGRTAAALFVLAYAVYGLLIDDLVIEFPVRQRSTLGGALHLHGVVAWTMAAAMLCAVAVLVSAVVDHYDKRDNEAAYRRFAARGYEAAWTLGIVAILMHCATLVLVQLRG